MLLNIPSKKHGEHHEHPSVVCCANENILSKKQSRHGESPKSCAVNYVKKIVMVKIQVSCW